MNTTQLGNIGEARAILAYVEDGWEVFTQFSGKAPFDLVAYKNGELRRVAVKCSSQLKRGSEDTYLVELKSVRPNRTGNIIKKLDNYDELCVYIVPTGEVLFLDPEEVAGRGQITVRRENDYRNKPMEGVRLVEGAVLKTVGCKSFGGSIPSPSALTTGGESVTVTQPKGV